MLSHYILLVVAYLLGSVPFGYLIGKYLYHIDIRTAGSKNIGATNVARLCGKLPGVLTFLLDFAKAISVFVYSRIFMEIDVNFEILICVFAILGHSYSIFLKFHGGKAVASSFACMLVIYTQIALNVAFFWVFIFIIFGRVGLASVTSAVLLLFFAVQSMFYLQHAPTFLFMLFVSVLIIFKHTSNIKEIRSKLSHAKSN